MNYTQKLKDPRYQKKRLQIFKRDKWTCQDCGNTKLTLHIHHKRYIRGNEPWDYLEWMLTTLCEDCHGLKHVKPPAPNPDHQPDRVPVDPEKWKAIFGGIKKELGI